MLSRVSRISSRAPRAISAFHTSAPKLSEEKEAPAGGLMGTGLDPLYAIPLGIIAGIPIINNQVLVLNEETQLVGCFAAFVITAYTQGGDAIAKMMDDKAKAITDEHNAAENTSIAAVEAIIDAHKNRIAAMEDVGKLESMATDYEKKAAAIVPAVAKFEVAEKIEKALQDIYNKELIAKEKVSQELATNAVRSVRDGFLADKKAVEASTAYAISALVGKADTNPIDAEFVKFFDKAGKDAAAEEKKNAGKIAEDAEASAILKSVMEEVKARAA
mmetsp:Transcript_23870/g.49741  ORF Transcript_23870/g.49741 Transcript_23870/m.49741 type:complete len:274 (+) Transcript_23870:30-851(+)